MRYRKRATEVEAMQLTKDNRKAVLEFIGEPNLVVKTWDPKNVHVRVMEGGERCLSVGDYIVKHDSQTFEVFPWEFFEINYEPVPIPQVQTPPPPKPQPSPTPTPPTPTPTSTPQAQGQQKKIERI